MPPRKRTNTPLSLWRSWWGGTEDAKHLCQGRAVGPVHRTPHFHEACYQGNKTVFNWGPEEKKKKEDGRDLFFGV